MASATPGPAGCWCSPCWRRHRDPLNCLIRLHPACPFPRIRDTFKYMTTTSGFTPPSPGAWELEQTHTTRPPSVFVADVFPAAMMAGFKAGTRKYCLLLDHLEVAVINRFYYFAPRPVGAPKSAKGAPPRLLFEIMRRVHPEMRRRVAGAETVFRDRLWRQDVDMWDRELKP